MSLRTFALKNPGATGFAFADKYFAKVYSLPLQAIRTSCVIEVINSCRIDSGAVTQITQSRLHDNGHEEAAPFVIT